MLRAPAPVRPSIPLFVCTAWRGLRVTYEMRLSIDASRDLPLKDLRYRSSSETLGLTVAIFAVHALLLANPGEALATGKCHNDRANCVVQAK